MITNVDHIGVAVDSLQKRLRFWAEVLGLSVEGIETVESEGVKVAFLPVGGSRIELLEPTGGESTISRFLERRGGGMHHLTLEVDGLDALLSRLRAHEIPLIGEAPRTGAGGRPVAFVHPKGTGGVLVELVQAAAQPARLQATIGPGAPVLLYLKDPQEKLWGVLRKLDGAGVVIEGLDLGSFDDWVAQIERAEGGIIGPSVLYFPAPRVEKLLLDQPSGELPSLSQRLEQRTGRRIEDLLGSDSRGS